MTNDTIKEISVDLISLPVDQQRIDIDEEKLEDLTQSIKAHGLISPITVRSRAYCDKCKVTWDGECSCKSNEFHSIKYEVVAGWRRLQAHKRLGLPVIKAIVVSVSDEEADVLRAHENEFRADINPVEMGIYYKRLQEKYNWDDERISKEMNRSIAYVHGRIELLTYPEYILEPLALGKISLGAATWIAKIRDDTRRRQYLVWAVQGGISVSQAHAWFQHSELRGMVQSMAELPEGEKGTATQDAPLKADCAGCGQVDLLENLGMLRWK